MTPVVARRDAEAGYTLVELLVVMLLMSVITFAIFTVIRTTVGAERYTTDLRVVMDDARASVTAVRKEIRTARNVLPGTSTGTLHFWVDGDQDTTIQPEENVWYCIRPIETTACVDDGTAYPAGTGFELVRWTEDTATWTATDPLPRTPPTDSRIIARTLLSTDVFALYRGDATVSGEDVPTATRVSFGFDFDARTASGPDTLQLASNVRLRNVDVE